MAPELNKKKQIRRGKGYSKKCTNKTLKIIGNNSSGLKAKEDSFENIIKELCPGVQETKLYRKGTMCFENYSCFEKVRGQSEGGGLMTLVHNSLNPVLIPTKSMSKMSINVLVVETNLKDIKQDLLMHMGYKKRPIWTKSVNFILF